MIQDVNAQNYVDATGAPEGGFVEATGLQIRWQKGPLGRGAERDAPNGAFVETVLFAALLRLEHYQDSRFNCEENAKAIFHVQEALGALASRTQRREAAGVEGTHGVTEAEGA
jgi:hypothetical protein